MGNPISEKVVKFFRDFFSACWAVIRLPFRLIGIAWREFFGLGIRKVLMLWVATIVVTIVTLTAFIEATSQPKFCVTCHYMQPYFDAWASSQHKNVTCTDCHMKPGLKGTIKAKFMALSMVTSYLTGVYKRSKPWAEIEDDACLREGCHDTRLLNGKVKFKGIVFDHAPHLMQPRRDRQLRCTSCHAQIVQGEHITVTETTCFLCHFKADTLGKTTDLARCTHCHQPPRGSAAADTSFDHTSVLARKVDCLSCHNGSVSGDGFVPIERCNSCHAKQEHIQRYKDREFVHQKHVTEHKVECTNCHIAIRHGKDVIQANDPSHECNTCHGRGNNAIEKVWKGTLPGFPAAPSKMAKLGMTCNSCHTEPIHLGNGKYSAPACEPCHNEEYTRLWKQWQGPLENALFDVKRTSAGLPDSNRVKMFRAIDIYSNGNPVHNPDLLKVLRKALGTSDSTLTIANNCTGCHPAAMSIAPEWNTRVVDHGKHTAKGIRCEACHMTDEMRHGMIRLTIPECDACHHREAVTNTNMCSSCHTVQKSVFDGDTSFFGQSFPSAMSLAEVKCIECHTMRGQTFVRSDPTACIQCHDSTYANTLKNWQLQGDNLMTLYASKLRTINRNDSLYTVDSKFYSVLRKDRSRTVHNPELFKEWTKRLETSN
jgi:nitrate/TMAO reductase-like tetraheme cytochrome c subunit